MKGTLDKDGSAIVQANFEDGGSIIEHTNAIIDTGANVSVCSPDLFDKLNNSYMASKVLGIVVNALVLQTEEKSQNDIYETMIFFSERNDIRKIRFIVKPIFPNIDFIIGSIFLRDYCEFTHNVEPNSFTFRVK